jgi:carbon storage regulator CsrA
MLILTRKTDQGIVIDDEITIRVLSVDGERVKLGISAPPTIQVLREELTAGDRLKRDHGPPRTPPTGFELTVG